MDAGGVSTAEVATYVAIVSTITGGVTYLITKAIFGTWHFANRERQLEKSFADALDEMRAETTQNLAEINRDMNTGFSTVQNRVGETVTALREKVHQTEIYVEKEFIRRTEFYEFSRTQSDMLRMMDAKIDARLAQQEASINRAVEQMRRSSE